MVKSSTIQKVGNILQRFNPLEDKYISREFQSYGYYLSEQLNDLKHRGIYMRLAKTMPRVLLEKALSYVKDANVKRKGALFMWKLKELGAWGNRNKKSTLRQSSGQEIKNKKVEDIPF
jgi:hypothetical protein